MIHLNTKLSGRSLSRKCGFRSVESVIDYLESFNRHLLESPLMEEKERRLGRRLPKSYHPAGEQEDPMSLTEASMYRKMLIELREALARELTEEERESLKRTARRRSAEEARSMALNTQIVSALRRGETHGEALMGDMAMEWSIDEDECDRCDFFRRNPDLTL